MTSHAVMSRANQRPVVPGRAGIAMVSVLLLLVAVGAISAGIGAMTVFNVQVSQNMRTQAVARSTAEQTLDTALVALAWEFRETGDLPKSIQDFRELLPVSEEYVVAQYDYFESVGVDHMPEAAIRITGQVVRGDTVIARHTVAARVQGAIEAVTTNRPGSGLGIGFVTNDDIVISGGGTFLLGMHAGGEIDVNGTVVIGGFSYLAVDGCKLGGDDTTVSCLEGPHPNVPAFDYQESRREMLLQLSGLTPDDDDYDALPAPDCKDLPTASVAAPGSDQRNNPTIINATPDTVYCLSDGFYRVQGSLSNGALIGSDRSVVHLTGDVNPDQSIALNNEWGVRVAVGDIVLDGASPLQGRNEIFARAGVSLNKGVTTVTVENVDGQDLEFVKTFIGAGMDIAFTGVGGTTTAIAAVANRAFCQNGQGGGNFIGTVNVSGTFSGAAGDATELNLNSELCGNSASGIAFNGKTVARLPDGMTLPATGKPSTVTSITDLGIVVLSRRP